MIIILLLLLLPLWFLFLLPYTYHSCNITELNCYIHCNWTIILPYLRIWTMFVTIQTFFQNAFTAFHKEFKDNQKADLKTFVPEKSYMQVLAINLTSKSSLQIFVKFNKSDSDWIGICCQIQLTDQISPCPISSKNINSDWLHRKDTA